VLARRPLAGWEIEPGTPLQYDPATDRLLATLRRARGDDGARGAARAVLIDATRLSLDPLERPVRQALWLPAG
jgi:hypothetical protein